MTKMKRDYYLKGNARTKKYEFTVKPPPVDLNLDDFVVIRKYTSLFPENVELERVDFYDDAAEEHRVATFTKAAGGNWSLAPGDPRHYAIESIPDQHSIPNPIGGPNHGAGIKITDKQVGAKAEGSPHWFKITFSDGGWVDPELINRGSG